MLNFMHKDKVDIYRYETIDNEDGTTGEEKVKAFDDVPCHISIMSADERRNDLVDYDKSSTSVKLFLKPNVTIKKSDFLVAKRFVFGRHVQTYRGYASDPFVYELSQEVILHDLEKK